MREALIVIFLAVSAMVTLRWPFYGVLCIVVTAVLRDTMVVETYKAWFHFHGYEVLYIATLFGLFISRSDLLPKMYPRTAVDWGMMGFLLVLVISGLANGVNVWSHKYIDLFFKATVLYFLLSRLADTPRKATLAGVAMVLATTYLTYLAWSKYRAGQLTYARPYLISSYHDFGLQLSITLPMIGALLAKRMALPVRVFLLGLVPLYVLVALRTHSRSAYLGIGVGLAMLAWYHRRRLHYVVLALPLVAYAVAHNPDVVSKRLRSIWTHETPGGYEDRSIQSRFEQMKTALRIIQANPLLGIGPRQFFRQYDRWAGEEYTGATYTMHNVTLLIMSEEGLMGLFCYYLLLTLGVLREAAFVSQMTRGDPRLEATGIVGAGAAMGFIAFCAYGLGQPQMWVVNIYIAVALVTASRFVVEAHLQAQEATEPAPQRATPALAGGGTTEVVFS
ncbi:MAG: O-antigen ligase family protein [Candidatus Brocadiia bacterium]